MSDFERKVLIILSHHNKRGHLTTMKELEVRTGREEKEIQSTLDALIKKGYLKKGEKGLIVTISIF